MDSRSYTLYSYTVNNVYLFVYVYSNYAMFSFGFSIKEKQKKRVKYRKIEMYKNRMCEIVYGIMSKLLTATRYYQHICT